MKRLIFLFFLCSLATFAQGVRFGDGMPISTAITPGGPLSAASNALISFCNFPGNAAPCTNKALTYTDSTLATPCSSSKQLVLATTSTCVGTTDGYGNWGVWVAAGNYSFTITLSSGQSLGPYSVTLSATQGAVLVNGNSLIGLGPANLINGTGPGAVGPSNVSGNNVSFGLVNFAGSQGTGVVTATYTNQQASDVLCFNASGVIVNCTLGVPIITVSTTPVAITTLMRGNLLRGESGAVNLTIPQAGSAGFASNFDLQIWNRAAAGNITITPATSTITGGSGNAVSASSAYVAIGSTCYLFSDGVNYYLPCAQGGSSGSVFPVTVSGTVNSGGIPCFTSTTNEASSAALGAGVLIAGGGAGACAGASSITDNGSTVSTPEPLSVGASIATTNDGVHPGVAQLPGNTTLPSLTANTVSILGPPSATPTAWSMQLPTAIPTTTYILSCVITGTNCLITPVAPTFGSAFPVTVTGGVSGAVPCFTSTTNEAAGTLLATNAIVLGGGAGACPATGNADFTYATHTLTGGASGLVDFSAMTPTTGFKLPTVAGAVPTADGYIGVNSTLHALVTGSNGTTIVQAAAGTGTTGSTTCTNQFVTVISSVAAPTCASVANASITSMSEDKLTGAAAQATITETAIAHEITRAGVETTTLTYPYVFQNTNATNTGTGALLVNTAGAGTAQVPFVTNQPTADVGDIWDAYINATVTNGVLSGGAIIASFLANGSFQSKGATAGFTDYGQGSTSAAVAPCNAATSICEQAPTSVTSYVITKNGAAPTVNGSFAATSTAGVQSWQTANFQFCGTTTSCSATAEPLGKIVYGSAALVSGTPSTAAVTGISPAFTATGDYVCTVSAQSAATTALLSVANVSASAFTITGPATVSTIINYICVGF